MANKIDTSQIIDPTALQPFTGPSLEFFQESTRKSLANICLNLMGPLMGSAQPIVLWGLGKSGVNIAEGAFFDNGNYSSVPEIFHVSAKNTTGFVNAPVLSAVTNYDFSVDPLEFLDGSLKNVHQVNTWEIVDSPNTGTTILYSNLQFLSLSSSTISTGAGWTGSTVAYYNNKTARVHFNGGTLGILTTGGTVSALPLGYRPTSEQTISVNYRENSGIGVIYTAGIVRISTAGAFSFEANFAGTTERGISLDGVSFPVY